jgi:transcriptional antiterminator RfaH
MALHWYVIHCEPSHDRQVERLIGSAHIEVFAPQLPKTRRRNGHKPLFPGYVFARLDLQTDTWGALRRLPGIRSLVEIGGGPCPLDDTVVAVIRRYVHDRSTSSGVHLVPGQRVSVTSGAFRDLEGIFCETLRGDERIAILVNLMRQQIRVELALDCVAYAERLEAVA